VTPPRTRIIHTTEGYRMLWCNVDGSFDHECDVVRIYGVETFETLDVLREALDLDGMSHGLRHEIGVQIRELAKAEAPAAPKVQEVYLCAYPNLSLRPDVLYRFIVDETCVGCVSLARVADSRSPGSSAQRVRTRTGCGTSNSSGKSCVRVARRGPGLPCRRHQPVLREDTVFVQVPRR
jgi:hypothetical protein